MINRILIRMKVVQLLYSYLLTRSDFRIAKPFEKDTRDNRFAYSTYLSLLKLIADLSSGINDKLTSITTKSLASESEFRDALVQNKNALIDLSSIKNTIYDKIISSEIYKNYSKKRKRDISDDVEFWTVIVDTILAKNESIINEARKSDHFTLTGFNQGLKMVIDTLADYNDTRTSLANARKALNDSLAKSYELYHLLLLIPVEITRLQEQRLENAKEKYLATSEDLNPDTRFIDNEYVSLISRNEDMANYLKSTPINFDRDYPTIKRLLDDVLASELYKEYMESPSTDRVKDCEFWRTAMHSIILPSDALAEMLENSSVYWNDDLDIMGTFALKTIRQIGSAEGNPHLLPMYKDDDDAEFGSRLFVDTISNRETYREYIDRFIDESQWDTDRLAFMDIVIMMVATSELINFPAIPIPVTLNEYIEIANSYSTPRSGQFVNGMLFSIINYLKAEGKLMKD